MNGYKLNYKLTGFFLGIISLWVIYLFKFYSFYKYTYFYVDKRLNFFHKMIIFLTYSFKEFLIYMGISFFLLVVTLFFIIFLYKKNNKNSFFLWVSLFFILMVILLLFRTILFPVFLVIFSLALISIYIIFIFVYKSFNDESSDDLIGIYGPFKNILEAQNELKNLKEKDPINIKDDIYENEKNQYYIELYKDESI